jgi:hypothetical protein
MQLQPTVSELRAASDEAVAAAQAGLGPLFASHLQTQLLERPQDFVNDQVPLVSAAGRARLALLDAEAAETDAATTPAALKRLLEREVSKVLGAQEQFEARVGEKLGELRTRVEKGEEAVHELVTVKGAELRTELTQLAAQQHEKSATELVEKMGAFRGEFQVAMMAAQAELKELRAQVVQLELRVLPGTGLVVDHKPLFAKLGYCAETTVDAFKSDIVKKTELNYAGKGLNADDARALAGMLGSFGTMIDIKKFDMGDNPLGNVGMTAISRIIPTGAFDGLEVLKLNKCGFSYKGLSSFVQEWLAYKTFRLTELKLAGVCFDVKEAYELLAECAKVGLLDRLKGDVFPTAEVQAATTTVTPQTRLSAAYDAADGKVMYVKGEAFVTGNHFYGSNPYPLHTPIGQCFMHLTGKKEGVVLLLPVEPQTRWKSSVKHGLTSNGAEGNFPEGFQLLCF